MHIRDMIFPLISICIVIFIIKLKLEDGDKRKR
jgi:hypothetical protein